MQALTTALGHTLDDAPKLINPTEETAQTVAILMVDVNHMPYMQQLMALAVGQGFTTTVAASIETAADMLPFKVSSQETQSVALAVALPDLVVINFVAGETDPILEEPILQMLLQFIAKLAAQWPSSAGAGDHPSS